MNVEKYMMWCIFRSHFLSLGEMLESAAEEVANVSQLVYILNSVVPRYCCQLIS